MIQPLAATILSLRYKILPIFVLLVVLSILPRAYAQTYSIQVGAWGDDASRGNVGVGVEIRTSIFPLAAQDSSDSFWVGDNLENGAFIQFGYLIQTPGHYCLYGESIGDNGTCLGSSDTVGNGDARWFWQYWPNGKINELYYDEGTIDSAGANGSWHHYQIWPNIANGWNFVLDNQTVSSFNDFKAQESKDHAFFVAEEETQTPSASGTLGPVEFRNLSYLTPHGWVHVQSLTAISGCGVLTPNCISVPYGVTVLGANDILAGTGEQLREAGELLWSQDTEQASSTESTTNLLPYQNYLTQTTATTSFDMNQLPFTIATMASGPWLWVGMLAALALIVVASTSRRQRRRLTKIEPKTTVTFSDQPIIETTTHPPPLKKCCHCSAEVPRNRFICNKCGMPTSYL